jgi:hypothetical protein
LQKLQRPNLAGIDPTVDQPDCSFVACYEWAGAQKFAGYRSCQMLELARVVGKAAELGYAGARDEGAKDGYGCST